MKVIEDKIIGYEKQIVHHDAIVDEDDTIIEPSWEETIEVAKWATVYRDMTDEEIAELPQEEPQEEPTQEERLSAIEDVLLEMMGV